jgi:hypothetical protein
MKGFFWFSGHIGWCFFSLVVFTALWWLAGDLAWRLMKIRMGRFLGMMSAGWLIGVALIALGFWLVAS